MHLPSLYAEDYTNQEYKAFFEIDSIGDRILLEYYFSDVAIPFLQNLHSNRKVTNRFAKKGLLVAIKTLISLHTRFVAAPS